MLAERDDIGVLLTRYLSGGTLAYRVFDDCDADMGRGSHFRVNDQWNPCAWCTDE